MVAVTGHFLKNFLFILWFPTLHFYSIYKNESIVNIIFKDKYAVAFHFTSITNPNLNNLFPPPALLNPTIKSLPTYQAPLLKSANAIKLVNCMLFFNAVWSLKEFPAQ